MLMETKVLQLNTPSLYETAGEIVHRGGLVAFPTETVYGLGGDALNPVSSERIYSAKGRPSDNPLIVHIATRESLDLIVEEIPEVAEKLMDSFWPGPLTLVFRKKDVVPHATTGGLGTVAVRYPSHPVARAFIEAAGGYIAAPSANLSGRPSPTHSDHVIEDMMGRIDMIIDGGDVGVMGLESTIVDVSHEVPMLLRPGFITLEMLERVVGEVQTDPVVRARSVVEIRDVTPKAPGMKYRHYAPRADLRLYSGDNDRVVSAIVEEAESLTARGLRVGIIATDSNVTSYPTYCEVTSLGDVTDEWEIARRLFSVLRVFDGIGVDVILGETVRAEGVGLAIMNRLTKAAGYTIIDV